MNTFIRYSHFSYQKFLVFLLFIILLDSNCLADNNSLVSDISTNNSYVCQQNDYALCSHAKCTCLDENGKEGACNEYSSSNENQNIGWSRCECPKIIQSQLSSNSPYKANFATLDCNELENPSSNGTAFPSFVSQQVADVYSTYSFGDSLPGTKFNTKNSAQLKLCDSQALMALCLDMPCETKLIDGKQVTTCYCQNVALSGCQSASWNTLGTQCKTAQCNPGDNKVWSASCVTDTLAGISDLYVYIRNNIDKEFTDIPRYCPN
jgi:hypothetical protein